VFLPFELEIGICLTSVLAHVEYPTGLSTPVEVIQELASNKGLSTSWKTHQGND